MKAALRNIVAHTYKPLLVKYLSKTRVYKSDGIILEIPPGVFHPGFFFSTGLLLNYIRQLNLEGKSVLEPGCGSGLISIYAARKKAIVTATDINTVAIEFIKKNSLTNKVDITIIESDLFEAIPEQQFDIIAVNPPYYKKKPTTPGDYAWYCGENGEYFSGLLEGLSKYMHAASIVLMVMHEGCDRVLIDDMAAKHKLKLLCVEAHKNLLEKNYIFRIVKTKP